MAVPILYLGVLPSLAFFVAFLGCILIRNCVLAILKFFCRLKKEFCGEVICRFLGF